MVSDETVARINALARKSKEVGLDPDELAEQHMLRRQYIDAVKSSLRSHLDHITNPQPDSLS